jgi:zinc protease
MAKEESLVMVGARTVSLKDPDRYAIDVLDSVLSGHSGRLFRDLRQEKALAYTLGCSRRFGIDGGYISFYAATTPDGIGESVKALESQIEDVRQNLVTDEELKRAKSEIIIGRRINMQANAFFSSEAALAETYGMGYETIYGYADMIDKVTKEDLKRVASKYLDPQKRSKVIIKSR